MALERDGIERYEARFYQEAKAAGQQAPRKPVDLGRFFGHVRPAGIASELSAQGLQVGFRCEPVRPLCQARPSKQEE